VRIARQRSELLSIALLAAVIVLAVELALVWETVRGVQWIGGLL
jgi:hypothetical protein